MAVKDYGADVKKYLDDFPGDLICARQIWYEGLGGQGVANAETVDAIEKAIDAAGGWKHIGTAHYEKFGNQNSWKRG